MRYVALAGLSVGLAFAIKQTGAYLFPPLIMSILADGKLTARAHDVHTSNQLLRFVVALCALGFATAMLRSGLRAAEILYLLLPVAASCAALMLRYHTQGATTSRVRWSALCLASAGAALPCAILLIPYVANGFLSEFVNGVILLPQRRLTVTGLPMLSASLLLFGIWMIVCMLPMPRFLTAAESRVLGLARWALAIALALLSLWNLIAYHFVWQSSRSVAALLPPVALWLLARERVEGPTERRLLFISCSMLAWASLVQFPSAGPAYFCYVTPLAVIAGVAVVAGGGWIQRPGLAPWVALVLFFAVGSLHRGYVYVVGLRPEPQQLDVPLELDRAHLYVSARQAIEYRRVTSLVVQHLQGGDLLAGPDCPEVYFLAGRFSPSGTLYEFFSESAPGRSTFERSRWTGADVVVVNHSPLFSSEVPPDVLSELRREFTQGELTGEFEVRWR